MHKTAAVVFSVLFAATAIAQQQNAVSVFYSNPSFWVNSTATAGHAEGGLGLGYARTLSPVFSLDLSVAREHYTLIRSSELVNGHAAYTLIDVHTLPFDLTARYLFKTDSRWKPYAGLGLRYVATQESGGQYSAGFKEHRIDPVVSGGVVFQFLPHMGLMLDAKQQIGTDNSHSDPALKISAGFAWRF